MTRVQQLLRFLWDFVIGDDWRIALAFVFCSLRLFLIARVGD